MADKTIRQDLTTKARLYARAGIAEYLVLDIKNRILHVFREPRNGAIEIQFEVAETGFVS